MNPALINLLAFFGLILLSWLAYRVFRSRNLLQSKLKHHKTLIEDILKQLYHVSNSQTTATMDNLSGALQIKKRKLLPLMESMTERGLVNFKDTTIELTEDGKQYALRIVRVHRLWEKYLAERTGYKASEWHDLAEKMEHKLNEEQTVELASFLGNPMFDPHGDPIPNELGEMSAVKWTPLPSYDVEVPGKIIHIEDEPEVIYRQILAKRLFIGSQIKLLKSDHNKVSFLCEGEVHEFSTIVAANIHVGELSENELFEESAVRLSALESGETAEVIGLSKECRGASRRRLLDLGILPGTKIEIDLKSPLSDPVAYRVRNTSIALRKTLSDLILINKN